MRSPPPPPRRHRRAAVTETLLKKLDRSGDQRIGLAEFQKAEEKAPLLFSNMLMLQDKFRAKVRHTTRR